MYIYSNVLGMLRHSPRFFSAFTSHYRPICAIACIAVEISEDSFILRQQWIPIRGFACWKECCVCAPWNTARRCLINRSTMKSPSDYHCSHKNGCNNANDTEDFVAVDAQAWSQGMLIFVWRCALFLFSKFILSLLLVPKRQSLRKAQELHTV